MIEYIIADDELWKKINSGELKGFNVQGTFYYGNPKE